MATFSIDELTTPVTVDQVRLSIYSTLAQIGVDTTTWKPGAVVRTMIAATAIMVSALSRLMAEIAKSGFLETAEGGWLTLLARNVYNVQRIDATFATAPVLIANSSGGIYVLSDGELQVTNLRTGATFVNVGPLTIPAVSSGSSCSLIATQAGSISTSLVTDSMVVSSPLPGVTIALVAAAIGLDEESDPLLRQRCLDKLGALSPNGPPDAYGFVARSATRGDGSAIGVTRVRLTNDAHGGVDVYVAGASGAIDPADLAAVEAAIQTQAAPLAVTARVHNATEVPIAPVVSVGLYTSSAMTDAQVQDAVAAQITTYFGQQPIGGNTESVSGLIYRGAIGAAVGATLGPSGRPLPFYRIEVNTPSTDIGLAINEVATLVGITVNVLQLPPPSSI